MSKIIKVRIKQPIKKNSKTQKSFESFVNDILISLTTLGILDEDEVYVMNTYMRGYLDIKNIHSLYFCFDIEPYYEQYLKDLDRRYPDDIAFSMASLKIFNHIEKIYDEAYNACIQLGKIGGHPEC